MSFRDRKSAGQQLASALASYGSSKPVVFALPRGGVPVAAEIAAALSAPLGLMIVRKLGVPRQPELAMGAVVYGDPPIVVRNESVLAMAQVSPAEFATVLENELAEARRRIDRYVGGRPQPPIEGRTVILVDDGIATGASMRAAVLALRKRGPKRIVVAVPVAATSTVDDMRAEVEDIVCLESHGDLGAIGLYYSDFTQVSDLDVIEAMKRRDDAAGR
jgi:putative phosphoribosyl transferase